MDGVFDAIEKSSASRDAGPVWNSSTLRAVWKAACSLAEDILLSQRSVCIPNVASFLVQEEVTHSGTWNVRRSFVPQLVLASSFQSSCHVANPVAVSQAQVGTKPLVVVNLVTVADSVGRPGVSRHTVAEMLKGIARTVGSTYLSAAGSSAASQASLNFGFAVVDLAHGKASVRWSKDFIARLQASYGVHKNDQVALQRRAASASSASRSAISATAPHPIVSAGETAALVPRPPESSKNVAVPVGSAVPPTLTRAVAAAPSAVATNLLVPDLDPASLTSASHPRARDEGTEVPPPLSPFHRHKFRKLQVRRQRREEGAFPETWCRQLKEKMDQQAVDAEESRRQASAFLRSAAAEVEEERALAEARRLATAAVQRVNVDAAANHRTFLLPKYEPMGNLLKDRPRTARLPPESRRVLEQQVVERQERERREAEENVALGQRLTQEAADYVKSEKAAKHSRFLRTQLYCKPNEIRMQEGIKSLKEQLSERMREDSPLNNASPRCFLAVPDDVILAKKDRRDQVVKEEKRALEQYSAQKRHEAREKKAAEEQAARTIDAMVTKSCILHQYEVSQRTLHQLENREAWRKQMKERQERDAGAKRVDAKCGPQAVLRNDSSDDES